MSSSSECTKLLLIGGARGDRVQRQLHDVAANMRLDMRQIEDVETALADVESADESQLVVLSPDLRNPVAVARRIHQLSPQAYLVLVADEDKEAELRSAISPVSLLGNDWNIARPATEDLSNAISSATQFVRQRLQLRTTLDRINSNFAAKLSIDVEEQRRSTMSFRFLANILENASDAIVATDKTGAVTVLNRAAERLFGVQQSEAVGEPIDRLAGGGWAEQLPLLIAQLAVGKEIIGGRELQLRRIDGAAFEVELVMTLIRDDDGKQIGISSIVRDVTERKQAAEAVRRSQQRLQSIIDSSVAVIYVKDILGRYQLVNRCFEELFGLAHDWIVGRTDFDLFPQGQAESFRTNDLAVLAAGAAIEFEEVVPLKDGARTYISIKGPLRDERGHPYAIYGISTNITERKQSEEILRRSEERVRLIVDSSLDAMITMNQLGQVTAWNPQAEVVFGWKREDALGRPMDELIIPVHLRQAHRDGLRKFLVSGAASVVNKRMELTALRKSGEEFPVELTISPLSLGDGCEFSAFIRDITERKRLESAAQHMNQELERRVAQRTEELARANDALERSNLELQQFAYIASHDLQSPLRSISGFAQLLQQDYGGQLAAQADDWINRLVNSTQRMQALIHDLLNYSRCDSAARPFVATDMHEVFADAVEALGASISDVGAVVTCGDLPIVEGDRSQLVQLVQNLFDNAIKYRGAEASRVHFAAQSGDREWLFSVTDNGIGIAAKYRERIFDIFQRLHAQNSYPGTGIGLAICRRVVHRHGGRIWVESEPDKGSVFYFTIPMRTERHDER